MYIENITHPRTTPYNFFNSLKKGVLYRISDIPNEIFWSFWNQYCEKSCVKLVDNMFIVVN